MSADNEWKMFSMEHTLAEKQEALIFKKRSNMLLKGDLQSLIRKLPEDMEQYEIKEFLPYDIRVQLLVSKYNIEKLLGEMNKYTLHIMLLKMCSEAAYFALLTDEEAARELAFPKWGKSGDLIRIDWLHALHGRNPSQEDIASIRRMWGQNDVLLDFDIRRVDMIRGIMRIIYQYKSANPKAAYKWIRMLVIMFQPKKRYYTTYGYNTVPILTAIPTI